MIFKKLPCESNNIIKDEAKLKYYILGVYRDVLMKMEVGSPERKLLMKRFDYLKDRPKYYWLSQTKF